jgi:hypothetical protein
MIDLEALAAMHLDGEYAERPLVAEFGEDRHEVIRGHAMSLSARPPTSYRKIVGYFTFPPGTLPRFSNRWTSDAISFFQSPSCRLSFGA